MIDDKYSICNGVLEKIISEEFQLNIFSIEKNPDIENLKDIGKTLITNYMYNVPLIEILFISLNMKCCTKLFLYVIKFSSLIYLNGLSSILLYLAFIFNFQQAMHIKLHIQIRNTSISMIDTSLQKYKLQKEEEYFVFVLWSLLLLKKNPLNLMLHFIHELVHTVRQYRIG